MIENILYLQDEFKDDNPEKSTEPKPTSENPKTDNENEQPSNSKETKPNTSVNLIDTSCLEGEASNSGNTGTMSELAGLRMDCGEMQNDFETFLPSQLLEVRYNV